MMKLKMTRALRVRKGKVAKAPAKRGLLRRVDAEPEKKKARLVRPGQ